MVTDPARAEHSPVQETVFDDANDVLPVLPGGLLLLVGATPGEVAISERLDRAKAGGFAGVVLKGHGEDLTSLVEAADLLRLNVVLAADEIPWGHLNALLSSALISRSEDPVEGGLQRNELFSIANAVAAAVGGSVAIEDLDRRVIAYSNIAGQRIDPLRSRGILDRRVPDEPGDEERYRAVLSARGIVRFPESSGEMARAAIAIRAGSIPVGSLWAIETEVGLTGQAERSIHDGAHLAALHLLRAGSELDVERLRRGEQLRNLLERQAPSASLGGLGYAPGDSLCLVAVAPVRDNAEAIQIPSIAQEVRRLCDVLRPDAPITSTPRSVYVLVVGSEAFAAAKRLGSKIAAEISRRSGDRVCAAVSRPAVGSRQLQSLRIEVDEIVSASAGHLDGARAITLSDVQSSVILMHVREEFAHRSGMTHPGVARLLAHDEEKGADLSATLLVWLEERQNVQAAARRLHLHGNTLRYRLDRIREISMIDFGDPDETLVVWLELRIRPDLGVAQAEATPNELP